MRFTHLRIRLLPLLLAMVFSGCHVFETPNWSLHQQVENSPLTPPRIAHDAVVIEVTFVRVPVEVNESNDAVWQDIDETHLSPQLRAKLTENGFRCGKLPNALPSSFEQLLAGDKNLTDLAAQTGTLNLNVGLQNKRLQCGAGSENHVVLSDSVLDSLVVVHSSQEYTSAERFQQAQCQFEFRTYPQRNGSVRIEIIPQIHHGAAKSQFKGHEGAWLLKTQRDIKEYSDLLVDASLQPGESLLLSCSNSAHGLGGHFFSHNDNDQEVQHMLRLRVLHTQYDDLFQANEASLP